MNLLITEKKKYEDVWNNPLYRNKSHGLELWNNHREFFPENFRSALDIGCGLGKLFAEWNHREIDAWGVDIVSNCLTVSVREDWGHKFMEASLWDMVWDRRFDFGICADVMEHIPTDKVPLALKRIGDCCDEVLFKIAHFIGNDLGGPRLHLTLRPIAWWLQQMKFMGGNAKQLLYKHRPGLPDSIIRWKV
jgi:SAM-dependent methyltransferase